MQLPSPTTGDKGGTHRVTVIRYEKPHISQHQGYVGHTCTYFLLAGGMMLFMRRYSTIWP